MIDCISHGTLGLCYGTSPVFMGESSKSMATLPLFYVIQLLLAEFDGKSFGYWGHIEVMTWVIQSYRCCRLNNSDEHWSKSRRVPFVGESAWNPVHRSHGLWSSPWWCLACYHNIVINHHVDGSKSKNIGSISSWSSTNRLFTTIRHTMENHYV